MMITLVVLSIVTSGVVAFYVSHQRVTIQEGLSSSVETALRRSVTLISDDIRSAGFGVPRTSLATWIPWVTGLTANPNIVDGAGGAPDTLSVASCGARWSTTLTAAVAANATTIAVGATSGLDTGSRRLINIGSAENAWVTSVGTGTLAIDSDPATPGAQGLSKAYPVGTVVCRVDVDTFSVDATRNRLFLDRNDGSGPQIVVDDIQDLQVDTVLPGKQYRFSIGAVSAGPDPATHAPLTRRISSAITVRN